MLNLSPIVFKGLSVESYLKFFGLLESPFCASPNLNFYCNISSQNGFVEEILSILEEDGNVIKVTGGCGVGKTLLYKKLITNLPYPFQVCEFNAIQLENKTIYKYIAESLKINIASQDNLLDIIIKKLYELYHKGEKLVLIIVLRKL